MTNLIKWFLSKTKKSILCDKQDELIGMWENEDDGSGLHALWGYGIEFLENGNGFHHNWGHDIEPTDRKQEIYWKRNSEKSISLKFREDKEWDSIEYEISDFIGSYGSKYYKLVEKGKDDFWSSPEPLYKLKIKS